MILINKFALVSLVLYMYIMGDFSLPPLVYSDYPYSHFKTPFAIISDWAVGLSAMLGDFTHCPHS